VCGGLPAAGLAPAAADRTNIALQVVAEVGKLALGPEDAAGVLHRVGARREVGDHPGGDLRRRGDGVVEAGLLDADVAVILRNIAGPAEAQP